MTNFANKPHVSVPVFMLIHMSTVKKYFFSQQIILTSYGLPAL